MRIVLATGNAGKLRELQALLSQLPVELVAQGDLGVTPCEEPAVTFVENALIKARHAAVATGLPAIADDSGLVVDALAGAPGVRSSRYAGPDGDDVANNRKLLDALAAVPAERRTARFCCSAVFLSYPDDPRPIIAEGEWCGHIVTQPRGDRGFGYDPLFEDPDSGLTAAELGPEKKNTISHRARALGALVRMLTMRLSS